MRGKISLRNLIYKILFETKVDDGMLLLILCYTAATNSQVCRTWLALFLQYHSFLTISISKFGHTNSVNTNAGFFKFSFQIWLRPSWTWKHIPLHKSEIWWFLFHSYLDYCLKSNSIYATRTKMNINRQQTLRLWTWA